MSETKYVESSLYDGRVKYRFYESSHQYWFSIDGGKFTRKKGCSTIANIKDKSIALGKWQQLITADFLLGLIENEKDIGHEQVLEGVAQCDILKDDAADTGRAAHAWCQAFINHKMGNCPMPGEPENPQVAQAVMAFLDWEKEQDITYHASEKIVYSMKYDYCGTLDVDATINGKRAILDFKVSSGLYNSVRMQTMGYAMAAAEENGIKYEQRWGLRLNKLTEEEYYRKERRKNEIKQFIAKVSGKEVKDYPIKPYVPFEAKLLAATKVDHALDKKGFLAALELVKWDAETDFYRNGN